MVGTVEMMVQIKQHRFFFSKVKPTAERLSTPKEEEKQTRRQNNKTPPSQPTARHNLSHTPPLAPQCTRKAQSWQQRLHVPEVSQ